MSLRIFMLVALFLMGTGFLVLGQDNPVEEPPVRLKKKKANPVSPEVKPTDNTKPLPKVDKKNPAKEDSEKDKKEDSTKDKELAKDKTAKDNLEEEEIFGRLGKNLKDVEDKLGNLEVGEPTLQKQRDILEDIDKLLKKNQNNQSQSSSKSESKSSSDSGSSEKEKSGQKQGGQPSGKKSGSEKDKSLGKGSPQSGDKNDDAKGNKGGKEKGDELGQGNEEKKDASSSQQGKSGLGNQDPNNKDLNKNKFNPASDIFKEVWGHLPETLRAELNAYGMPNQFMDRYDESIRKYYSKVAEKGAKKK